MHGHSPYHRRVGDDRCREEHSEIGEQAHELPAQTSRGGSSQAEGRGRSFRLRLCGTEADPAAVLAVEYHDRPQAGVHLDPLGD